MVVGRHAIVDVWEAGFDILNDRKRLYGALAEACEKAGAERLHEWGHSFDPQGVTILIGLAESHASLHTYPELGYYGADIFTCGDLDPRQAMFELVQRLGGRGRGWFIERGSPNGPVSFLVGKRQ